MRNIDLIQVKTFRIDRETVILGGDFHLLALNIKNWLISTVVSKFQFERAAAQCEPHDLMAQTNSEDGFLTKQSANVLNGVFKGFRIARTIRKKNTVRL